MLTQLREENIFDLRREFNAIKKENPKNLAEIEKTIIKSILGFINWTPEYPADIYLDQDGHKHLVFLRKTDREVPKEFFYQFYNNTFLSGDYCRNTTDLIYQKTESLGCHCIEKGYEDTEVSFLTVISLFRNYGCANPLSVMTKFQHWLHSTNK